MMKVLFAFPATFTEWLTGWMDEWVKKWGSTCLIRLLFFSILNENEKCYWIIFRVPIFHLETFRPTCRSVINHRKWCLPVRSSQHTTHSTYYSPSSLCSSLESELTKCRFLFSRYRVRLVNKSYNGRSFMNRIRCTTCFHSCYHRKLITPHEYLHN